MQDETNPFDFSGEADPHEPFYNWFDHGSDRAIGVTLPITIERQLDKMLSFALIPNKEVLSSLFRPDGVLFSYGNKTKFAYVLGLIGKQTFEDLKIIGKIRNRFAHEIEAKDFSDSKVKNWVESLHMYKVISNLAAEERDIPTDDSEMPLFLTHHIAKIAMEDTTSSYKECVRFILMQLQVQLHDLKQKANVSQSRKK